VLFGFLTRLAVLPLAFTMFMAVFFVHAADPFRKKEPAVICLLLYAVLLVSGSSRFLLI
jgi:putative oxidoreductase